MKLSAILVSVNLVALPAAAQAAEEAVSDKAEWLKRNLAAMGQAPKPENRKISMSDPGITPRPSKLKNFTPGRHLPRRAELEYEFVAQQARLDQATPVTLQALVPRADGPLTGQISAYGPAPAAPRTPVRSYGNGFGFQKAAKQPIKPAPQAVPGKIPTLPGQIAAQSATPAIPVIPEPPVTAQAPVQPQRPSDTGQLRVVKQSGALLVQAPVLTPDEQSMLDELVALNRPGRSAEFQDLQGASANPTPNIELPVSAPQQVESGRAHADIGPPPFPLNLLPEDQLKEFIRGRRSGQSAAPPAYFGSWHKQSSIANLPSAGFRSFAQRRSAPLPPRYGPVLSRAVSMARRPSPIRHHSSHKSMSSHVVMAHTQISQAKLLMYPPYQGLRVSSF